MSAEADLLGVGSSSSGHSARGGNSNTTLPSTVIDEFGMFNDTSGRSSPVRISKSGGTSRTSPVKGSEALPGRRRSSGVLLDSVSAGVTDVVSGACSTLTPTVSRSPLAPLESLTRDEMEVLEVRFDLMSRDEIAEYLGPWGGADGAKGREEVSEPSADDPAGEGPGQSAHRPEGEHDSDGERQVDGKSTTESTPRPPRTLKRPSPLSRSSSSHVILPTRSGPASGSGSTSPLFPPSPPGESCEPVRLEHPLSILSRAIREMREAVGKVEMENERLRREVERYRRASEGGAGEVGDAGLRGAAMGTGSSSVMGSLPVGTSVDQGGLDLSRTRSGTSVVGATDVVSALRYFHVDCLIKL